MSDRRLLQVLRRLSEAAWIAPDQADTLAQTLQALHQQKMLGTLTEFEHEHEIDTREAAAIFERILGIREVQTDSAKH